MLLMRSKILPLLKGVSKETILSLPAMADIADETKLHAMQFMDLLTIFCNFSSPMLMHIASFRMAKLTFTLGFSDEHSISGLIVASHGLVHYSNNDNIWLATKICRIAESVMKGNSNEHSLRARMAPFTSSVLCFVEPFQAATARLVDGYTSATIVGDVDNFLLCGLIYGSGSLFCTNDLVGVQKTLSIFMREMAKHKRLSFLYCSMSYFDAYTALIGNEISCGIGQIQLKTNKELFLLAKQTQNNYLMHQVILNQIHVHCYFREYSLCASLAGERKVSQTPKRTFDFFLAFYSGIFALNLARDTKQDKWKEIGESALVSLTRLVEYSTWNFENKQLLLRAELHYLDGRCHLSELVYQSSIASAQEHKFTHEEAMACELYGIHLVETKKVAKGLEQLQIARKKYKQWGALRKAGAIKDFIELVDQLNHADAIFKSA
jgi:hypothetical protein